MKRTIAITLMVLAGYATAGQYLLLHSGEYITADGGLYLREELPAGYPPQGVTNLVLWYEYTELSGTNCADSSAETNTAFAPASARNPGRNDGWVSYDGIDDALELTQPCTATNGARGTFMTWVKIEDVPQMFFSLAGPSGSTTFFRFGFDANTDTLFYTQPSPYKHGYWTNIVTTGVWHHVAVTATTTGDLAGYLDGLPMSGMTASAPTQWVGRVKTIAAGAKLAMGNIYYHGSWTNPSEFDQADTRIYNRDLKAAEILTIYNSTKQRGIYQ